MALPEVHLVSRAGSEAVKLAPVVMAMRAAGLLAPVLITSGSPAEAQALAAFDLTPDVALTDHRTEADLIKQLDDLWAKRTPAAVIVEGDTGLAGALAAFWRRIPIVHVGAGLRADDLDSPFPQEADRRLVAQVAALHLAPTPLAAMNLLDEGIATGDVLITGTTAVDAALAVAARKLPFEDAAVVRARSDKRLVLVTVQRRESWGDPLVRILAAVRQIVAKYRDVEVVVTSQHSLGEGIKRVIVTDSLAFPDLTRLLSEAVLLLTDSDGIQEAPSFRVPALVVREVTERVESLHAGCAKLVGADTDLIVREAFALLDSPVRREAMTAGGNPYGDGLAAARTAQATAALLGLAEQPEPMPSTQPIVNQSAAVTFGAP